MFSLHFRPLSIVIPKSFELGESVTSELQILTFLKYLLCFIIMNTVLDYFATNPFEG